jgi:hypothetical protein
MRMHRSAAALVALLAAACSDGTAPDAAIDADDAAAIALDTDAITGEIVFAQMLLGGFSADDGISIQSADTRDFSRSRNCPAGGSVELDGTIDRTGERGNFQFDVSATGTWIDCAHARRDVTRSVNGSFTFTAHRSIVDGQFDGPQTSHKAGSFAWSASNGNSGECTFDITATRYPDLNQRTVQGTICGRSIDRTVTWNRGDG